MAGRRSFWTNVTLLTASVTLIGGIVSSALALSGNRSQAQTQFDTTICQAAYNAIGDETVSADLSAPDRVFFIRDQLKIVQKCASKLS
jgi:hypothetical protein